jgi:hypothetical protein
VRKLELVAGGHVRRIVLTLVALAACLAAAPAQAAVQNTSPVTDVEVPLFPVPAPSFKPLGFSIDADQAFAVAKTSPAMQAIHRTHHPLQYRVYAMPGQHYEVYFFFHRKVIGDVLVSKTGRRIITYTGLLTTAFYARNAYGDVFDSPWVWVTFGLLFLLPLARLRRASGSSWWDRLDLAMVLSFGVSYALFDNQHLSTAVWLAYPSLLYLLVRMLARGRSPAGASRLECRLPLILLAAGVVALTLARAALALAPGHVMDVGAASAIGAWKILHGQSIYYTSLGHGDTYGPIAYLAYVPFQLVWPGANWFSYLTSVRAATIAFDVLTIGGLILVGRRLRTGREGTRLGLTLAWLWAACPFSLLGMVKNTNDGLVALLVVILMLTLTTPVRRGVVLGLAAAAKFFPAVLLPLMLAPLQRGSERLEARRFLAGFVIAAGTAVAVFLPPGGLKEMYDHTIGFQLSRPDVFSVWALHPALAPLKVAVELGVVALAVLLAVRPRGARSPAQVAALAAALSIAIQLPAVHWFYLYIVWFLPLALIAVLGSDAPSTDQPEVVAEPLVLEDTPPDLLVVR